jgi:hypothetical protein
MDTLHQILHEVSVQLQIIEYHHRPVHIRDARTMNYARIHCSFVDGRGYRHARGDHFGKSAQVFKVLWVLWRGQCCSTSFLSLKP